MDRNSLSQNIFNSYTSKPKSRLYAFRGIFCPLGHDFHVHRVGRIPLHAVYTKLLAYCLHCGGTFYNRGSVFGGSTESITSMATDRY